jgi:hypothetical protein
MSQLAHGHRADPLGGVRRADIGAGDTELIRTVHTSTFAGIGHPQRDHYTVTSLTGQASRGSLPP